MRSLPDHDWLPLVASLMRKGQDDLLAFVNGVLARMAADGTLVALKAKYGLTHDPVAKSTFLSRTKSAKPAK